MTGGVMKYAQQADGVSDFSWLAEAGSACQLISRLTPQLIEG
jgi:hypothetical protein